MITLSGLDFFQICTLPFVSGCPVYVGNRSFFDYDKGFMLGVSESEFNIQEEICVTMWIPLIMTSQSFHGFHPIYFWDQIWSLYFFFSMKLSKAHSHLTLSLLPHHTCSPFCRMCEPVIPFAWNPYFCHSKNPSNSIQNHFLRKCFTASPSSWKGRTFFLNCTDFDINCV